MKFNYKLPFERYLICVEGNLETKIIGYHKYKVNAYKMARELALERKQDVLVFDSEGDTPWKASYKARYKKLLQEKGE